MNGLRQCLFFYFDTKSLVLWAGILHPNAAKAEAQMQGVPFDKFRVRL